MSLSEGAGSVSLSSFSSMSACTMHISDKPCSQRYLVFVVRHHKLVAMGPPAVVLCNSDTVDNLHGGQDWAAARKQRVLMLRDVLLERLDTTPHFLLQVLRVLHERNAP